MTVKLSKRSELLEAERDAKGHLCASCHRLLVVYPVRRRNPMLRKARTIPTEWKAACIVPTHREVVKWGSDEASLARSHGIKIRADGAHEFIHEPKLFAEESDEKFEKRLNQIFG